MAGAPGPWRMDEAELLPSVTRLLGLVAQRSSIERRTPPPIYALCDPGVAVPVLSVTLKRPKSGGAQAHASMPDDVQWRRCRLLLWGLWADRLAELVQLDCTVVVTGAEVEGAPDAAVFGSSWQLSLPSLGAKGSASVVIIDRSGVQTEVTAAGIRRLSPGPALHAPAFHPGGNTAAGDASGGAKRQRRGKEPIAYEYSSIQGVCDASGQPARDMNFYGVVVEYQLPRRSRGTDMRSVVYVVDESCAGASPPLAVNFFKAHPQVPGVGSVVRFHRVRPSPAYEGKPQAQAIETSTQWVFGDLAAG